MAALTDLQFDDLALRLSPLGVSGLRPLTGGASSVTIENITISGTFDFATPAARREAANALVVEMKEAIRKSDRSRI